MDDLEVYTLLGVLQMATRQSYEEELSKINDSVFAMGNEVEKAIDKTLFAFQNLSVSLSNEIMKHDDAIDAMEYKIEDISPVSKKIVDPLRVVQPRVSPVLPREQVPLHAFHLPKSRSIPFRMEHYAA